jgi:hypothetical protein
MKKPLLLALATLGLLVPTAPARAHDIFFALGLPGLVVFSAPPPPPVFYAPPVAYGPPTFYVSAGFPGPVVLGRDRGGHRGWGRHHDHHRHGYRGRHH